MPDAEIVLYLTLSRKYLDNLVLLIAYPNITVIAHRKMSRRKYAYRLSITPASEYLYESTILVKFFYSRISPVKNKDIIRGSIHPEGIEQAAYGVSPNDFILD
jgi:hypothetical protein